MKYFLLTTAVFISIGIGKSQYTITNFNTANSGLSTNKVFSIAFDNVNTAWFGFFDNPLGKGGIGRYDGVTWDLFRLEKDSLFPPINNIAEVLVAPNEDKWICNYGGSIYGSKITKMDSSGFMDVTPSLIGLTDHGITNKNSIWFNSFWTGLYEYNYDSLKWIFHNNFPVEPPIFPITAFNIDSTGTQWVAVANKNIFLCRESIIDSIHIFPSYPPDSKFFYYIRDIAFDTDGTVWMGTSAGLLHWFQKDSFTIYNFQNSDIQSDDINQVRVDNHGRIWNGSYDRGLSVFDGQNFTVFDTSNLLMGSNEIKDIELDKEGNIWVATWGAGVYKFGYNPSAVNEPQNGPTKIEVFPNPVKSSGELTIRNNSGSNIRSFSLLSMDGKLLRYYDEINADNRYVIRALDVLPGFYMGMITDAKGNQSAIKIMVVD